MPMNRLERLSARTAILGLVAVIVAGGFVLALYSNISLTPWFGSAGLSPAGGPVNQYVGSNNAAAAANSFGNLFGTGSQGGNNPGNTYVIGQTMLTTTMATVTEVPSTTTSFNTQGTAGSNFSQGSPSGAGGLIEFSSDLSLRSSSPSATASGIIALAYSVGGYVAYQSTYSSAANVVIRVPAAQYEQVLTKIEGMGTLLSLTSNSNDVRVQYTDLNATLLSLRTEQVQLLKLLNQSTTINSTLAIESQLQGVDQQINDIESQILQTRTLVTYSTINVSITVAAQQILLSMTPLSPIPNNGTAPLSVTFNAIVKGGAQPYVVNYNFGDGTATEGQIVIHTYYQPGNYKIIATATDQNGTVTQQSATIKVVAAPSPSGISNFLDMVGGLFVNVIEGIVEVAVVVLPIAAVGAAIIIPVQRRRGAQKSLKQSQ